MESSNRQNIATVRAKLEFPVWHRTFTKAYSAWSNAPSDLKTPLLLHGPALSAAESWLLDCPDKLSEGSVPPQCCETLLTTDWAAAGVS